MTGVQNIAARGAGKKKKFNYRVNEILDGQGRIQFKVQNKNLRTNMTKVDSNMENDNTRHNNTFMCPSNLFFQCILGKCREKSLEEGKEQEHNSS